LDRPERTLTSLDERLALPWISDRLGRLSDDAEGRQHPLAGREPFSFAEAVDLGRDDCGGVLVGGPGEL
jgi:hypothetical protein